MFSPLVFQQSGSRADLFAEQVPWDVDRGDGAAGVIHDIVFAMTRFQGESNAPFCSVWKDPPPATL